MQTKKNFIHINESFKCKKCGNEVQALKTGCRNHCNNCLYSLHVDEKIPGDRLSNCLSLMEPTSIESNKKKGLIIYHKCLKCSKIIPNKSAEDDNQNSLILIMQTQHATKHRKLRK